MPPCSFLHELGLTHLPLKRVRLFLHVKHVPMVVGLSTAFLSLVLFFFVPAIVRKHCQQWFIQLQRDPPLLVRLPLQRICSSDSTMVLLSSASSLVGTPCIVAIWVPTAGVITASGVMSMLVVPVVVVLVVVVVVAEVVVALMVVFVVAVVVVVAVPIVSVVLVVSVTAVVGVAVLVASIDVLSPVVAADADIEHPSSLTYTPLAT